MFIRNFSSESSVLKLLCLLPHKAPTKLSRLSQLELGPWPGIIIIRLKLKATPEKNILFYCFFIADILERFHFAFNFTNEYPLLLRALCIRWFNCSPCRTPLGHLWQVRYSPTLFSDFSGCLGWHFTWCMQFTLPSSCFHILLLGVFSFMMNVIFIFLYFYWR